MAAPGEAPEERKLVRRRFHFETTNFFVKEAMPDSLRFIFYLNLPAGRSQA